MNHPTDDELILHHYEEDGDPDMTGEHLLRCQQCQTRWEELEEDLTTLGRLVAAGRGEDTGCPDKRLWSALRPRVLAPGRWGRVAAGSVVALTTFVLGWVLATRLGDQRTTGSPELGSMFQIILNVRDMHRQVAFYKDTLSLELSYPPGVTDFTDETFVRLRSGKLCLALHSGRVSEIREDEPRISFLVQDLERCRGVLEDRGVALGQTRTPAPGVEVIDFRDPEGNALHIERHRSP